MPATADLVQELVTVGGFGDIMDQASLIYGFVRDELTRNGCPGRLYPDEEATARLFLTSKL